MSITQKSKKKEYKEGIQRLDLITNEVAQYKLELQYKLDLNRISTEFRPIFEKPDEGELD